MLGRLLLVTATAVARRKKGILLKIQTWQNEKLFLKAHPVMNTKENVTRKINGNMNGICQQALLFGRAKQAARERASRILSRASRASTFHDIPQIESLLAG